MTIQIDIDEKTLAKVDKVAKTVEKSKTNYILDAINKSVDEDLKKFEIQE